VFEISPVSGDRCVATIGNDQNMFYRVEGTGDLAWRGVHLPLPSGMAPGSGAAPLSTGTGSASLCRSAATVRPGAPGDLAGLSDAELSELRRRAGDEVTRRLREG